MKFDPSKALGLKKDQPILELLKENSNKQLINIIKASSLDFINKEKRN